MDATKFILRKWEAARNAGRPRILVGVCGRAGSGKSTVSDRLVRELGDGGVTSLKYSGDWRFFLDSAARKNWLAQRSADGLFEYLYSLNQFSWWDFSQIREDLEILLEGGSIRLEKAYDRTTGRAEVSVDVGPLTGGVLVYDNAILGGVDCLRMMDAILLLNTPDSLCFERTLKRDAGRRSLPEIAARYLVTTYSENVFFESLTQWADRTVTCDGEGKLGGPFSIVGVRELPVPLGALRETCALRAGPPGGGPAER